VLRTDNSSEFTSTEFASYCTDEGIQRHFSTPYSPQQNGVVKQRNQIDGGGHGPSSQTARNASQVLG
jgi:transposase InsO family protein